MSNSEVAGWRDERISRRHRLWGNIPAADLDFVLVEYDFGRVVGLVEYKHWNWRGNLQAPSIRALADLGSRAGVPVLVTRYLPDEDGWVFHTQPANEQARGYQESGRQMTEAEWVNLLHRLRAPADRTGGAALEAGGGSDRA